jgi:hypothetical protein
MILEYHQMGATMSTISFREVKFSSTCLKPLEIENRWMIIQSEQHCIGTCNPGLFQTTFLTSLSALSMAESWQNTLGDSFNRSRLTIISFIRRDFKHTTSHRCAPFVFPGSIHYARRVQNLRCAAMGHRSLEVTRGIRQSSLARMFINLQQ